MSFGLFFGGVDFFLGNFYLHMEHLVRGLKSEYQNGWLNILFICVAQVMLYNKAITSNCI